jgi:subtilisin family serine protease
MKRIDLTLITLLALTICTVLAIQAADAVNVNDDLTVSNEKTNDTVRVIIGFNGPVTDDDAKYLEWLGGVIIHKYSKAIHGVNAYLSRAAYDKLLTASNGVDVKDSAANAFGKKIKAIEEDVPVYLKDDTAATGGATDSITVQQGTQVKGWNIARVNADYAWPTTTGKGVRVLVIDTGIDSNHPDLRVVGGYGCLGDPSDWEDEDGHGTNCSGIIADLNNNYGTVGVAPDVALYAVKAATGVGDNVKYYPGTRSMV